MNETVAKNGRSMRMGYTTGSCAAAAAKAATATLLSGKVYDTVELDTPKGIRLRLDILDFIIEQSCVSCAVKKDAGDDPDTTNGIKIYAKVEKTSCGIVIGAGEGIGRVTKPGLACKVGDAAINPVPRKMIENNVSEMASKFHYTGGLAVTIFAPDGEETAKSTYNSHLGIIGGISILGTSGIVEPMSEAAIIDTIKVEIDARLAMGTDQLLVTPGNYGQDFALREFGLDLETGVKCSNYIGETLDYCVYKKISSLLLIGHAGKLTKLAAGVMNTHSRVADCRAEVFAAHAAMAGADRSQVKEIMECVTTDEMHRLITTWGIAEAVWQSILNKAMSYINHRTGGKYNTEVIIFTNNDGVLAATPNAVSLADEIRKMEGNL